MDALLLEIIVPKKIGGLELTAQLKRLGLRQGDVVMTHASMRKVGKVEGGAKTLIEAQLAYCVSTIISSPSLNLIEMFWIVRKLSSGFEVKGMKLALQSA